MLYFTCRRGDEPERRRNIKTQARGAAGMPRTAARRWNRAQTSGRNPDGTGEQFAGVSIFQNLNDQKKPRRAACGGIHARREQHINGARGVDMYIYYTPARPEK